MKFLLDMGISPESASFLRESGHEATHLHQEQLDRLPDPEILGKARAERAVLVAHDLDFPDRLAASGEKLPSVVLFRLRNMQPENVNRHLRLVLDDYQPALREGAILTVTEGRIRQRLLPIKKDPESVGSMLQNLLSGDQLESTLREADGARGASVADHAQRPARARRIAATTSGISSPVAVRRQAAGR